jgi:hypothetical protein
VRPVWRTPGPGCDHVPAMRLPPGAPRRPDRGATHGRRRCTTTKPPAVRCLGGGSNSSAPRDGSDPTTFALDQGVRRRPCLVHDRRGGGRGRLRPAEPRLRSRVLRLLHIGLQCFRGSGSVEQGCGGGRVRYRPAPEGPCLRSRRRGEAARPRPSGGLPVRDVGHGAARFVGHQTAPARAAR